MRLLAILFFLFVTSVQADELLVLDQNGLNRLRKNVSSAVVVTVTTEQQAIKKISLVSSAGFGNRIEANTQAEGSYTFQNVPPGRYIIEIDPASIKVKSVKVQ